MNHDAGFMIQDQKSKTSNHEEHEEKTGYRMHDTGS